MGVIAKYKFNNTLEANLLPEFNSEFTSDLYTVTDEVDGEVTTRTIESDSLPTLIRFGSNLNTYVEGSELALLEVLDMNTNGLISCRRMFRYCENLTGITCEWDTSNVTDMSSMFVHCNNLISLDSSNFNTSNVTDMQYMFYECNNLTSLDLSGFNTSNVTSMYQMFYNCNNLTSLDVSNFDTSKVTNMSYMFANCYKLTSLDVSNWNTSEVTTMHSMFSNCYKLTSLDVSNFNTSNVTVMQSMFYNCNNLTSLDVSNFNTSNVTVMQSMFYNCNNLTSLDVSNWNTSKVTSMNHLFELCKSLTYLDLRSFDTSKVTSMYYMFANCSKLISIDISDFLINENTNIGQYFANTYNLKYLKCNNVTTLNRLNALLPTKSLTSQGTIICKSDTTNLDTTTLQSKYWNILDEPTLVTKYVFDKSIHNNCIPEFNTEFEGYFIEDEVEEGSNEVVRTIESCGMLPTKMKFGRVWVEGEASSDNRTDSLLEISEMNTSGLTSCSNMFRYCKNLTSITCEWETSNVTSMDSMFTFCKKLALVDVSNFDTSNVTNIANIFYNCNKLTSLDVSNWDTSNVTNMSTVFYSCYNLTSLDVSNFDTSKATNMHAMFYGCTNLTTLDVSNFNTSKVTNMRDMFRNTPLLTDISVLYMDKSSLQKLVNAMPTDSNKTLWYKDVNIDGITHGDNITLKKYIEENVEIVLNSPLLEGDTIEVHEGKLCHYHKMGRVVLDGSEDEGWVLEKNDGNQILTSKFILNTLRDLPSSTKNIFSDKFRTANHNSDFNLSDAELIYGISIINLRIMNSRLSTLNAEGFKQWLSKNPTTVVYELAEPYYEDITPLQSSLALRTFEECNIQIITALPIKTKITYRTNITSAIVMEQELDTLDSGVSLSNLIEEEVDE